MPKPIETNWYVVTGGPSSGKTKIIERLAFLGYKIVSEAARNIIDLELSKGKTIKEIRADERQFQRKILKQKLKVEDKIPSKQLTFFDRGIPDSMAYYQLYNQDISEVLAACKKRRYKGVFLLELLSYENDYARIEDEKKAVRLGKLIFESYSKLGYSVIRVPVGSITKRVKFILNKLKN